jgi:hypothetical protein
MYRKNVTLTVLSISCCTESSGSRPDIINISNHPRRRATAEEWSFSSALCTVPKQDMKVEMISNISSQFSSDFT